MVQQIILISAYVPNRDVVIGGGKNVNAIWGVKKLGKGTEHN